MGEMKMIKRMITIILLLAIFLVGCSKDETEENDAVNESEPVTKEADGSEEMEGLPNDDLQKGSENESVHALQKALIEIGYPVEETGIFDELTTWAITDIQLQQEDLAVNGVYDLAVKNVMEQILHGELQTKIGSGLEQPTNPNEFTETIENPYEILVLVNKSYALPADFEPEDLVVPNVPFPFSEDDPKKQLRQEAAHALEQLFAASKRDGLELYAQSGFRSYDRQEAIFASNVEAHGEEHANTFSARAGESEHQSGLVMDVTSQEVNFDLITDFGDTNEGKWLKDYAHEYGFIVRYPEGKENITKYQYEPWHLRYVGKKVAEEITANDLTLEEYLGAK